MDPAITQALISGGLSGIGSWLNADATKDASKKAYKRAKEFAQSGIQWKVADAAAAGINPYFALGAPTATYSDAGVGVDPLGSALESMGQNISRAALTNTSAEAQASALTAAQIESVKAQTELTKAKTASEIRLATQPGSGPGFPISPIVPGQVVPSQPNLNQNLQAHYGGC